MLGRHMVRMMTGAVLDEFRYLKSWPINSSDDDDGLQVQRLIEVKRFLLESAATQHFVLPGVALLGNY